MPAKLRKRHLVTVELGQYLWNRIEALAQSQHRTRANLCRIIIAQYINQQVCPTTTDTKTLSRQTKP